MRKLNRKQVGNTLLGLIIGLIIGLVVAVLVAIVITRAPMPFTNKAPKTEVPAALVSPDHLPDPNQSLYSRKETVKAPIVAVQGESTNAAEKKLDALVEKVQDKSPVDTSAKNKTVTNDTKKDGVAHPEEKEKVATVESSWRYFLQVGAFRDQPEAESTKARLALMGFETRMSEHQADSGALYRVRLGPFAQLEATNRVREKLLENGVSAAVIRAAK